MGRKILDITGVRFGNLMAVRNTGEKYGTSYLWECLCDCGEKKIYNSSQLVFGKRKSCGCRIGWKPTIVKRRAVDYLIIYGITKEEYNGLMGIFWNMRSRCYNKRDKDYKYYGAKGVTICDEWLNNPKQFVIDMAPRPHKLTIDRIDTFGSYSKENCRWATMLEQNRNQRKHKKSPLAEAQEGQGGSTGERVPVGR